MVRTPDFESGNPSSSLGRAINELVLCQIAYNTYEDGRVVKATGLRSVGASFVGSIPTPRIFLRPYKEMGTQVFNGSASPGFDYHMNSEDDPIKKTYLSKSVRKQAEECIEHFDAYFSALEDWHKGYDTLDDDAKYALQDIIHSEKGALIQRIEWSSTVYVGRYNTPPVSNSPRGPWERMIHAISPRRPSKRTKRNTNGGGTRKRRISR